MSAYVDAIRDVSFACMRKFQKSVIASFGVEILEMSWYQQNIDFAVMIPKKYLHLKSSCVDGYVDVYYVIRRKKNCNRPLRICLYIPV